MKSFTEIINEEILTFNNIHIKGLQFECSVYYGDRLLTTYATIYDSEEKVIERIMTHYQNFISFEKLASRISKDDRLPLKLRKSINLSVIKRMPNELVSVLLIDYEYYIERVVSILDEAHKILGIDYDELMNKIDYHYKDQRPGRINNAFAELRAVIALNKIGFENIQLCSGDNNLKKADIIAFNNKVKYVIDVLNYSNTHLEKPELKFTSEKNFIDFLENKYRDKKDQLHISKVEQNSNEKGLFAVIDEINSLNSLNDYDEIHNYIDNVWRKLSFREECDLFILMRQNIFYFKR